MRPAPLIAGALVIAAAVMAVVAFTSGDDDGTPRERAAAPPAATPSGARNGQTVWTEQGCGSCHTVRGTPADGSVGPDLTHVASRRTIGKSGRSQTIHARQGAKQIDQLLKAAQPVLASLIAAGAVS